jgi:predicted hotdog family 3-hydroxylacyl-ACP dehydratase
MSDAASIDEYLPHRGTARLVDRLVEAGDDHAVVEADIPPTGNWVRDGGMPSWVGIELMAQAVAAWAGAKARREGRPVPVGFLLGTRRYEAHCAQFAVGRTLRITARRDFVGGSGLGAFDCVIEAGGECLAQARLSVFEPADARPYLDGSAAASP